MPFHFFKVIASKCFASGSIHEAFISKGIHKFVLDARIKVLEKCVIFIPLLHGSIFVITIGISQPIFPRIVHISMNWYVDEPIWNRIFL